MVFFRLEPGPARFGKEQFRTRPGPIYLHQLTGSLSDQGFVPFDLEICK